MKWIKLVSNFNANKMWNSPAGWPTTKLQLKLSSIAKPADSVWRTYSSNSITTTLSALKRVNTSRLTITTNWFLQQKNPNLVAIGSIHLLDVPHHVRLSSSSRLFTLKILPLCRTSWTSKRWPDHWWRQSYDFCLSSGRRYERFSGDVSLP